MCAVSLFCGVVGIISFFVYLGETSRLTFRFPPGEQHAELYVKGEALTPDAATWIANHPGKTDSELADSFGGVNFKERVWTHDSIGKAEIALAKLYTLFVVSLTSAVLFLSEGLLVSSKEKSAS